MAQSDQRNGNSLQKENDSAETRITNLINQKQKAQVDMSKLFQPPDAQGVFSTFKCQFIILLEP